MLFVQTPIRHRSGKKCIFFINILVAPDLITTANSNQLGFENVDLYLIHEVKCSHSDSTCFLKVYHILRLAMKSMKAKADIQNTLFSLANTELLNMRHHTGQTGRSSSAVLHADRSIPWFQQSFNQYFIYGPRKSQNRQ